MPSIISIYGSSFNESFDFQGFSSGAMENNHHSHLRSRERSPHERSNRDSNREERRLINKENRPENIQEHQHYIHLPHLVPREAERLPAGQAKVLKIHNHRILLKAEIHLAEVNARRLQWWQLFLPYRQLATYQ